MSASVHPAPQRLKLSHPEPDEDALHASVAAALNVLLLPPAQWTTFPCGGYELSAAASARLARLGVRRGWPDILLVHNGALFGIELKTRTGRLSKSRMVRTRGGGARHVTGQVEMLADLQRAGVRTAVCRSTDEVLAQLAAWGIPTRNHHRHPGGST
jgi:hypothetical protein